MCGISCNFFFVIVSGQNLVVSYLREGFLDVNVNKSAECLVFVSVLKLFDVNHKFFLS